MRRIVMLLGVATVMLVMAAGVAVAVNKQCQDTPCRGTDNSDELHERIGNHKKDRILALRGGDLLDANNYSKDQDRLEGGAQGDRLLTNDLDNKDRADGGRGNDKCIVDAGDNTRSCTVRVQAAGVDPAGFTSVAPAGE